MSAERRKALALARCARSQRQYLEAIDGRKADVANALELGATYQEIAHVMGVSKTRAYELANGKKV